MDGWMDEVIACCCCCWLLASYVYVCRLGRLGYACVLLVRVCEYDVCACVCVVSPNNSACEEHVARTQLMDNNNS